MTKSGQAKRSTGLIPRLAARHFKQGKNDHHVTLLLRPAGHRWLPERDFRIYPRPLPSLASLWERRGRRIHGLTVILGGRGRLHVDARSRPVEAGDVIVFDGSAADSLRYDEGPEFAEASVSFDALTARRLDELGLWPDASRRRRVDPRVALVEFEALHHAIEIRTLAHAEVLRRAIRLLGWLDQGETVEEDASGEDFAARACALLRKHHGPADRVEVMAAELGYSPGHFRRRFRRAMGMSPAEYQLRERMTRAAALLRNHGVQGAAAELGYSDPFVFSRQFKAQVGVPPKVFRAALRRSAMSPATASGVASA